MKNNITDIITNGLGKARFLLKKNSPTILIVGGVIVGLGSTITACIATTKLRPVIDETKEALDAIHDTSESLDDEDLTDAEICECEKAIKRATTMVYIKTIKDIAKLYSIPTGLGILSIACILSGNQIMHKRNAALTAAYVALDNGYKNYKARIINRFGKDVERQIRYGLIEKEIEEEVINEKGEKVTVKKTVEVPDGSDPSVVITDEGVFTINGDSEPSPYSRYFDSSSTYYDKDSEYNLSFLTKQESYFNDILRYKHYIFLNDVYERLGLPKSRAGQAVGWVYDPDKSGKQIDFGIYNILKPDNRDFVNGYTSVILLDFNVKPILNDVWPDEKDAKEDGWHRTPLTC